MMKLGRWIVVLVALACVLAGPQAAQDPGQSSGSAPMRVDAYGVGGDVVDRELQGESATFPEGQKVWFWTRVVEGSEGDRIEHVWLKDGEEMLTVGLVIGGPYWRTWSNKTLHPGSAGAWAVEARDASGNVLARAEFTCE